MLRIIIAAVVISIFGTLWCNSPSPRPHAKGKFVTATALNVRDKPSTSSNIVGKLIRGASVNALSEQDGWFQILYGQDTAWVHGDFVGTIEDVKRAERELKRKASRLADAARTPASKPKSAIEKKAEAEKVAIKPEKQREAKRNDLSQTSEPKTSIPPAFSKSTKQLLALYIELHSFKDDPEFHQVGFGVCCRFYDWQIQVEELQRKTKLETFREIELVPGDLLILGSEYIQSKGRPTKYTQTMEPLFRSGLKALRILESDSPLSVKTVEEAASTTAIIESSKTPTTGEGALAAAATLADSFKTFVGKKIPYHLWGRFGFPKTLEGTNNTHWIAYLPKADVSFVSRKDTDIILYADDGKKAQAQFKQKQDSRDKYIKRAFSSRDSSHGGLTKWVKENMNDPDSYEHVSTSYVDMGEHLVINMTFRGKNMSGDVVEDFIKAKVDIEGNVLELLDYQLDSDSQAELLELLDSQADF